MDRISERLKAALRGEEGHALTFLLISLGLMMVFAVGIYIVSEAAVAKIRAQNAADAAALAGAGVLADCLDLLVFANWIQPLSWLFGPWGSPANLTILRLKNEVIRYGPTAAIARAIQVGWTNNKAIIIPANMPDLGVRYRWLGPVQDRLLGRTGNRFVELAAVEERLLPKWVQTFLGEQTALELALNPWGFARGIVHGSGMLFAHYSGGLGRID
ncbi:MAG: hypothetical protein GX063_04650 [Firmicutes bacterium]|nr:hypothetical protein [Bacillota bacterium]NLY52182.1 hypothetical protein [Bacillota bacterium]